MRKYLWLLLAALLLPILSAGAEAPAFIEAEENNAANQATMLVLNADMRGDMKHTWSDKEADWYRLYIPENGRLDIRFRHDYINDDDDLYVLKVQSLSGQVLRIIGIRENEDDILLSPLYLPEGFYHLVLLPQTEMENGYILRADYTSVEHIEEEFNDGFSDATILQPGVLYQAGFGSAEDVDRYLLRITQNSQVVITAEHLYSNNSSTVMAVETRMGHKDEGILSKFEMSGLQTSVNTWPLFLTPGDYYITAMPWYSTYVYNYQIKADVIPLENIEKEVNNDFQSATPIALNTAFSGALSFRDDDDFFTFTLDAPGSIDIRFEHEYFDSTSDYYQLRFYDSSTNDGQLFRDDLSGRNSDYARPRFYLDAGTYFLSVSPREHTGRPYTLTLNYGASPDIELERNNTYGEATQIQTNKAFLGSFLTEDDKDFFTFTLDAPSSVSVGLAFDYIENDYTFFKIALDTQANNSKRYYEVNVGGNNNDYNSRTFYLDAGTYYLSVTPSELTYNTYALTINAQPEPMAETEWNNDYAQADSIQPGGSVIGSIRYEKDIDRYTFTLTQPQTLRPRFSHEYSEEDSSYWNITLDGSPNSSNRLQEYRVKGTDGDMGEVIQLPAGTYYLSVGAYYWYSLPYTLYLDIVNP